jgi:hypothetical protein
LRAFFCGQLIAVTTKTFDNFFIRVTNYVINETQRYSIDHCLPFGPVIRSKFDRAVPLHFRERKT